jgi:hypothetical protein
VALRSGYDLGLIFKAPIDIQQQWALAQIVEEVMAHGARNITYVPSFKVQTAHLSVGHSFVIAWRPVWWTDRGHCGMGFRMLDQDFFIDNNSRCAISRISRFKARD